MMNKLKDFDVETFLYAGDENEAECTELIPVMKKKKQKKILRTQDWYKKGEIYSVPYDERSEIWRKYNYAAIEEIRKRIQPHDIICLPSSTHAPVANAFPEHISVETGVGYEASCCKYRVFESYAWMHTVYGYQMGAAGADGKFYDQVIPNFFEIDDFPEGTPDPDNPYFLFMSRMIPRKGYEIAIQATERIGAKLIIAGIGGDKPKADHVEYVGLADTKKRAELMGGARAILVPTLYVEPFGGVAVEAMLCGTPAITTDFGAFTETVIEGKNGYRCHTLNEFCDACNGINHLDRFKIRDEAQARFGTKNIALDYFNYFTRLEGLWDQGFYNSY